MLQANRRAGCLQRSVKFDAIQERHKFQSATPVLVKNPVSGLDEEQVILTMKEEPVIDSHLREEDFSLQVILRNSPQNLKDCGYYLQPSTPEEYSSMLSRFTHGLDDFVSSEQLKQQLNVKQEPISAPSNPE